MTENHASGQQQILVVDDSEDMRTMLGRLVERAGYRVLFAEDGRASLIQAQQHHPDLILMDLSLPDMDGWEAVIRLREMEAFRTTPIIAVTAHVSSADQERALAVGCTVHIGKPFKTGLLLQSIHHLLTGAA
jgi:two-component system, cell cycle response regulator DivK